MAASTTAEAVTGLVCPECGRTFTRPQGLAAHRRLAHGVIGSSKQAAARRRATTTGRKRSRPASGRAPVAASAPALAVAGTPTATPAAKRRRTRKRAAATNNTVPAIDRDALLALVYPNGIPARENVIRAASSWLDEAERLARER